MYAEFHYMHVHYSARFELFDYKAVMQVVSSSQQVYKNIKDLELLY